jgi:hypothetical protein
MTYKAFKTGLDQVHDKFKGRYSLGGQRREMSIFEFVELLQLCGIVPHHVHENDVRCCVCLLTLLLTFLSLLP